MRTIVIRLTGADLAVEMASMRTWLDEHRYQPSKFTCAQEGAETVISADFNDDAEAQAFKGRFDRARREPKRGTTSA